MKKVLVAILIYMTASEYSCMYGKCVCKVNQKERDQEQDTLSVSTS